MGCVVVGLLIGCASGPMWSYGLRPGGGEHPAAVVVAERRFRRGEYAGDSDVVAQLVSSAGHPLWNSNQGGAFTVSMPVASSEYSEHAPVAMSDGHGGTIVVYQVVALEGPYAGIPRIWAQRLDSSGRPTWNEGMRSTEVAFSPIFASRNPVMAPDGRGGVIVVYEAEFLEGDYAGDADVMAQRLNRYGQPMWGEGVLVASSQMIERAPAVVSDGRGGVLVVYEGEARDGEYAGDSEIMAQRISRSGQLRYYGGIRSLIVSAGRVGEKAPVVVSDRRGGAIALFEQHVRDGPYEGRVWIAAQRITRGGRLPWNGGQRSTAVSLGPFSHGDLTAVPDGRGGAIAVFGGILVEGGDPENDEVFAQRISRSGALLYGSGELPAVVASSVLPERDPQAISDGRGGVIVVYEQVRDGGASASLAAQRLDGQGERLWGGEGMRSVIVARQTDVDSHRVVAPDGRGGVVVFFEDELEEVAILDHSVIQGQRLDPEGRPVWNGGAAPATVSGSLASEERPEVARP